MSFDILRDKSIIPVIVLNILHAHTFTPQNSESEADEEDVYELCYVMLLRAFLAKIFDALHYFGKG
jgi:hypothetical protein